MSLTYTNSLLRVTVAKICQDVGWHTSHVSALNVLSDLLANYIKQISASSMNFANHAGRSQPTFDDLAMAFDHLNIDLSQLQNYVLNVDSSPLDMKAPFYPLPCKQNRVLDHVDPEEERPEYYYEWLPSLKCTSIDYNSKNLNTGTIEEVVETENIEEQKEEEAIVKNDEEKMDVDEEKLEQEKDLPDDENKNKLVFKFSLGKSLEENQSTADQSKGNENPSLRESIQSQLMTSRAYLKFLKSSLFTNPDDPNILNGLRAPDSQRLSNNYKSRENSPEPDLANNINSNGLISNIDPLNGVDIDLKKHKRKELAKTKKKSKNKENDLLDSFGDTFGLAIKPNIKVKEIGLKKEKKGDSVPKGPKAKKTKDGSKLNIKVTGFGLADGNQSEIKKEIEDDTTVEKVTTTPKKRKYVKKERPPDYVERRGRKPKNATQNIPKVDTKNTESHTEKESLLSLPSETIAQSLDKNSTILKDNFGDNDYNAAKTLVFMSESHDTSLTFRDDDSNKKKPDSSGSSGEESMLDLNDSNKSTAKKSAKPLSKRSKGVNSKKIVKSAEVVESSDDSSSDNGPDMDTNSLSSLKFSELDNLFNVQPASRTKRRHSGSSISSLSSNSSHSSLKSISIRSASNDFEMDSIKTNKKFKSNTPLDLSVKETKSKDSSGKHKKNKKHSKEKHRSEKGHKKHKKLKEREKDGKEKVKDIFKPKLNIKLGINTDSLLQPAETINPFDECHDMNANLEPPPHVAFPKYIPKGEESILEKKKRGPRPKKIIVESQNELVFIKDKESNIKSKESKKMLKTDMLFDNLKNFEKSNKTGKQKTKDNIVDKLSLLDTGKKTTKLMDENETKLKSKQKDSIVSNDFGKVAEKKKDKSKDDSKQTKKNENKSCTVVRETITVDEKIEDKLWICPNCKLPDVGTPMIGCDTCDDWYHYECVGIVQEPKEDEPWFCPVCLKQKKKSQKKPKSKLALKSENDDSVTITPIPFGKSLLEPCSSGGVSLLSKKPQVKSEFPVKSEPPIKSEANVTVTPSTSKPTSRPRGRPRKDSAASTSKAPSMTITPLKNFYMDDDYDFYPSDDEDSDDIYDEDGEKDLNKLLLKFYSQKNVPSASRHVAFKPNNNIVGAESKARKNKKDICLNCDLWIDAPMIGCDYCDQWFHWHCVGIDNAPSPDSTWLCGKCRKKGCWKKYESESEDEQLSLTDTKFLAATSSQSKPKSNINRKQPLKGKKARNKASSWRCATCFLESTNDDCDSWIGCDGCDQWYHFKCAGVTHIPVPEESWFCRACIEKQASIVNKLQKIKRI